MKLPLTVKKIEDGPHGDDIWIGVTADGWQAFACGENDEDNARRIAKSVNMHAQLVELARVVRDTAARPHLVVMAREALAAVEAES